MALTLAVTTVIARCVGAGDYGQVHYYTKKLILITYVCNWVLNAVIFLLLPLILRAYNLSDLTAQTTEKILLFHSVSVMLVWPVSFTLPASFRAAGDVKACMAVSIFSMWIFRIMFSYLLGKYLDMGVFGIWVAMVIDWIFRAFCFTVRY